MPRAHPQPPYPYDGVLTGTAYAGESYSPPTRLQEVLNQQPFQTMPRTRVDPTDEQGMGRPPGFQWPWMAKAFGISFHSLANMSRHPGVLVRPMAQVGHQHGSDWSQWPSSHQGSRSLPVSVPPPATAIYASVAQAGGEPL